MPHELHVHWVLASSHPALMLVSFEMELSLALKKEESGMVGAIWGF